MRGDPLEKGAVHALVGGGGITDLFGVGDSSDTGPAWTFILQDECGNMKA